MGLFGDSSGSDSGGDSDRICFCCYTGDCQSPLFHCIVSAYLSIIIGAFLTVLSFLSAWSLHSMSMYALSLMAFIDTAGSVIVVYFLQWRDTTFCGGEGNNGNELLYHDFHRAGTAAGDDDYQDFSIMGHGGRAVSPSPRSVVNSVMHSSNHKREIHFLGIEAEEKEIEEQRLTFTIGIFMAVISCLLLIHSIQSLWVGANPSFESDEDTAWSNVISVGGTFSGLGLAFYKYYVAKAAKSSIVMADAISSFCTGLASLVSLIVTYVNDFMWWFDGTAGLLIAVYTLYSGVLTMINARSAIRQIEQESSLRDSASKSYDHFLQTSRNMQENSSSGNSGGKIHKKGSLKSKSSDNGSAPSVVLENRKGKQTSFDAMKVKSSASSVSGVDEEEGFISRVSSYMMSWFSWNRSEYSSIPDAYYIDEEREETVKRLLTKDPDEVVTFHI